jgi:tRNA-Thr(GGU) m(6)t(6)A37 methyltransferase TsaA
LHQPGAGGALPTLEELWVVDTSTSHRLLPIGWVRSSLERRADAPRQGSEGAPDARLQIQPAFLQGLDGIKAGQEIVVLTWLHEAQRDVLTVHPRDDQTIPLTGVFATRSPDRPNPVGLHRVKVLQIENDGRLHVQGLEAIDGTPVIDIKPVLAQSSDW